MARIREATHLRSNNKLIRHAAIRRILYGRYHVNGIKSLEQLQTEMLHAVGIRVSKETLSTDLKEMGAIKVTDAPNQVTWYSIPVFNPNVEDIRGQLDPDQVEHEVGMKLAAHAIDVTPVGRSVYVMTEPRAGMLVGYWLGWLHWQEILLVHEFLDSAEIVCLSPDAALSVAEKLIGWGVPKEVDDREEGDGEEEAGDDE